MALIRRYSNRYIVHTDEPGNNGCGVSRNGIQNENLDIFEMENVMPRRQKLGTSKTFPKVS